MTDRAFEPAPNVAPNPSRVVEVLSGLITSKDVAMVTDYSAEDLNPAVLDNPALARVSDEEEFVGGSSSWE